MVLLYKLNTITTQNHFKLRLLGVGLQQQPTNGIKLITCFKINAFSTLTSLIYSLLFISHVILQSYYSILSLAVAPTTLHSHVNTQHKSTTELTREPTTSVICQLPTDSLIAVILWLTEQLSSKVKSRLLLNTQQLCGRCQTSVFVIYTRFRFSSTESRE